MPFIPHTRNDVKTMLEAIGASTVDELFDEIPKHLLSQDTIDAIPEGMNEMALMQHMTSLSSQNQTLACFTGAGSYDHHIPAAVWDIASRGEFLTAYTPYQAEASQGTLQLLFEYQSMMAALTGLEVANASMYDGATALAEAILMAVRLTRKPEKQRILVPETLHPFYRQTIDTILRNQDIETVTLPMDSKLGVSDVAALETQDPSDICVLIIPQPNFFGCLEPIDAMMHWAESNAVLTIACVNPMSLGLLAPPGEWGTKGVDIACGDGQPLGIPMSAGGPYFGFLSTKKAYVRQMPGRLVGRTVDTEGKTGFTLTLQAREQHIRRAKATSNICTNQGLLVTCATIYMSLLGGEGLQQVAQASCANTHKLTHMLTNIPGVTQVFSAPTFHETCLHFDVPVSQILTNLKAQGIAGGYPLHQHVSHLPENALLICATEKRTLDEMNRYAAVVAQTLRGE